MSNQFYLLLILMLIFIKFVGRSQKHDLFLFGGLKKKLSNKISKNMSNVFVPF